METLIVLVSLFSLIFLVFVFMHLRPLTEKEVKQVGANRREKKIRKYFSFDTREYNVDKEFKKQMNPNGKFYNLNEDLITFPSTAAALLKRKKHEWIIIALEKHNKVYSIWLNKGFDRSRVSPYLSVEQITDIANQEKCESILIFHNHPNSNPNHYDCTRPSDQDIKSANEFAQVFNRNGMNLVEFVCERGRFYEYLLCPSDIFSPLSEFILALNNANGSSKFKNLSLHFERIFSTLKE